MSYKSGLEFEKLLSQDLHENFIPILISPLVIRRRGGGQIDIALYKKGQIILVEVKKYGHITYRQLNRLRSSGMWLAAILNCDCQLWLAKKLLPKGYGFTNLNS